MEVAKLNGTTTVKLTQRARAQSALAAGITRKVSQYQIQLITPRAANTATRSSDRKKKSSGRSD